LWKELNHHSPILANKLKSANSIEEATNIWREQMQKSTMSSTLSKALINQRDNEMEQKLRANPMDEEANAYFGEKIRKENVEKQYRQMMEEFPESMGRVLMLYIDAEVNGHPIQAFVDSGAQNTIMSSTCAERCGLLHLLDTRFSGVAIGVGTGKILGRVHVAEMKVKGLDPVFPCSITVMDDSLGNKNMDFLLGLDMLKRHRCNINLDRNVLQFRVGQQYMETPFLHEKDLSESKGGTLGFDADKNNEEIDKMMQSKDKPVNDTNE
jgi:DNA damage-inducible protein 1